MKIKKIFIAPAPVILSFLISFLVVSSSFAQKQGQAKIDSLQVVLKTAKEDTNKVNVLYVLGWELRYRNPDTAIILGNTALRTAEQITLNGKRGWQQGIAKSYNLLGNCYNLKCSYPEALKNHLMSLKISEQTNNKKGIAASLTNIGNIYRKQADYSKALDYYFKALKMHEENGSKNGIAITLGNIGIVYQEQADYSKALDYYFKALKMDKEIGDKNEIARDLGNIGIVYKEQADYSKGLYYYFKALKMNEEIGNKNLIAMNLGNIGNVYMEQADYSKALDYDLKALKLDEEIGEKNEIARNLGDIGDIYVKTGKFKDAEAYLKKSLAAADSIKALKYTKDFEQSLSQLYDTTGRPQLALVHYKKYIAARDSIANDENTKKQTRSEMNYEFDKKEALTKAETEKELQKQKLLRNGFIGGFAVVLLFAGVFFTQRNRIKKEKKISETANKDLKDAQEQLIRSEKMVAFGVMASRVSHEIQNPLNFVNNFSDMSQDLVKEVIASVSLEEKKENADLLIANLQKINEHGKRAATIVKQLQERSTKGTAQEFFEENKN